MCVFCSVKSNEALSCDCVRAHQLLRHLLDLGDEVGEELRHVLLLPGVERLFVHGVGFAEGSGVISLPLALLDKMSEHRKPKRQRTFEPKTYH